MKSTLRRTRRNAHPFSHSERPVFSFTLRIDSISPPRDPVDKDDWYAEYTRVEFTILSGFDHEHRCAPQFRIAAGDLEQAPVQHCVFQDSTHRTGAYFVNAPASKHSCGQVLSATVRTQLNPVTTRDEVLDFLGLAPDQLAISFYPNCAWIHFRDDHEGPGKDNDLEMVPDPHLLVEMLRDGLLDLDLNDERVVLAGHAKYPSSKEEARTAAIDWMIGSAAETLWPYSFDAA